MIDIHKILEKMPHRYPMLLVDRIIRFDPEKLSGTGIKNVTINEPHFTGHYPENPIMPGVLIIEAIAQVCAATMLMTDKYDGTLPLLASIDDVRFKRVVQPGDQLVIDVELVWIRSSIGRMKGVATVDGEIATSLELTFKLIPRKE